MKSVVMSDLKLRTITAGILCAACCVLFILGYILPSPLIVFGVLLGGGIACVMEWLAIARAPFTWIGAALIIVGTASFIVVHDHTGWQGCVYVAGIAALTDTLAYLAGSLVGGPKLCPSISPGKTWSGALIGFALASTVGATVLISWKIALSWGTAFVISALLCGGAQAGDLLESAGKRRCKVKDTGTLLPGHGGIVDRVDSWLMSGIIAAILLLLFPLKASASPYDDWIDRKGLIKREKREDFGFLLKKTGFCVGVPIKPTPDQKRCVITSWHIDDIMKAVQGKIDPERSWFVPGERWEMKSPLIESRKQALDLIERCKTLLHLKKGIKIDRPGPGFLLLGTTAKEFYEQMNLTDRVLKRLDPTNKKNLHVYVLTGPRALLPNEKTFLKSKLEKIYGKKSKYSVDKILERINSEEEMIGFMLKNTLGSGWRAVQYHAETETQDSWLLKLNSMPRNKYHLIIGERDANRGRATTATTVVAWVDYMNKYFPFDTLEGKGRYEKNPCFTIVSNAPFIEYQWQVIENIVKPMHPNIEFNAIGPAWKSYLTLENEPDKVVELYAAVGLDTLSRLIYELHKAWLYQTRKK